MLLERERERKRTGGGNQCTHTRKQTRESAPAAHRQAATKGLFLSALSLNTLTHTIKHSAARASLLALAALANNHNGITTAINTKTQHLRLRAGTSWRRTLEAAESGRSLLNGPQRLWLSRDLSGVAVAGRRRRAPYQSKAPAAAASYTAFSHNQANGGIT